MKRSDRNKKQAVCSRALEFFKKLSKQHDLAWKILEEKGNILELRLMNLGNFHLVILPLFFMLNSHLNSNQEAGVTIPEDKAYVEQIFFLIETINSNKPTRIHHSGLIFLEIQKPGPFCYRIGKSTRFQVIIVKYCMIELEKVMSGKEINRGNELRKIFFLMISLIILYLIILLSFIIVLILNRYSIIYKRGSMEDYEWRK